MRRKDLYILISVLVCLFAVFIFMTKNTRFESTLIVCERSDNKIRITYSKLDQAKQISFITAGVEEKKLNFTSKSNDTFEFSDNGSAYFIDLEKSIASQIRKGETVFYQCKKSQFKM